MPAGLGEPLYDKLDAEIAYAMMGINAVKGVEIGAGFGASTQKGSEHGDELSPQGFRSNHAGGVLGGISTGQDMVVSIADQTHQLDPHAARSRSTAPAPGRTAWKPTAGTTLASASAPCRSPRRCWRWC